jgi:putative ubiquitin-RnfH superfamily antitoxin RatB of RatAB toxin-antitoxin module
VQGSFTEAVVSERARIHVEVVLAWPGEAQLKRLDLPAGATVGQAIDAAGLGAALSDAGVGIWGRRVGNEVVLVHGDRVEIYRPLQADPKDSRRRRAVAKAGLGSA